MDAFWQPGDQVYPRLSEFDATVSGLEDLGGVYAIWHLGVRPQWLRIGASENLSKTFEILTALEDVAVFDRNRGVFVAWAPVPEEQWAGIVKSLTARLAPALQGLRLETESSIEEDALPVDCPLPPGTAN
tara:strand:- start:1639 stop:2028 length:390 start_codon:yes stop_codon:yes gene_type:complete